MQCEYVKTTSAITFVIALLRVGYQTFNDQFTIPVVALVLVLIKEIRLD